MESLAGVGSTILVLGGLIILVASKQQKKKGEGEGEGEEGDDTRDVTGSEDVERLRVALLNSERV